MVRENKTVIEFSYQVHKGSKGLLDVHTLLLQVKMVLPNNHYKMSVWAVNSINSSHCIVVKVKRKNMQHTLRVVDGSPENSSPILQIARFAAGSITLAAFRMPSSLSLM